MKSNTLALALLAGCPPLAHAQTLTREPPLISGRVFAIDSNAPLRNARVSVTSDNDSVAVVFTDGDGGFVVPSLAAGSFRLEASKSGYITASFGGKQFGEPGKAVPVAEREIVLHLPKAAAISGRILDDRGDPVIGMTVTAEMLRADTNGQLTPVVVTTTQLDDLGEYRLGGLPEGSYLVSVDVAQPVLGPSGMPFTGDATPFTGEANALTININGQRLGADALGSRARSYYPGVSNLADSEQIRLAVGQERTSLDFSVPSMAPRTWLSALGARPGSPPADSGAIRGRVTRVDGRAIAGASVRLLSDNYPGTPPSTVTDAEGRYELPGLAPATFRVVAERSGFLTFEHGQRRTFEPGESIEIRRSQSRESIDVVLPTPGAIAGRLLDEFGDPVERVEMRELQIAYEAGRPHVTDTPLPFGTKDQSIGDLELILTDRVTGLTGTVNDARGRGVGNAPVIVFATDRERWGPSSRFVTMARSGRDGTFGVRQLPPGEYFVASIDRIVGGEWQDPNLLELLVPSAAKVTLAESQKASVTVRLIVR